MTLFSAQLKPAFSNSHPRVTVLMTVFNGSSFLGRAIDSILRQTYLDFEFMIVDDGSTDDSLAIIESYAHHETRIRLLRNERNQGLAAALNRGLEEARGDYIARMDADDSARPKRLELQVEFMDRHPDVGICGGQILVHEKGKQHRVCYPIEHAEIHAALLFHSSFAHPAVMLRRISIVQYGYRYDQQFITPQDYDLWSRMVGPLKAANLPQLLIDYYCHGNQLTKNNYQLYIQQRCIIRKPLIKKLLPGAKQEDFELHDRISFPFDIFDLNSLSRAEQWLIRLIDANRSACVYDDMALRRVFARRWLTICGQSAYMGMQTFFVFWRSPLRNFSLLPFHTAKLLAKCAIRHKYG